MQSLTITGTVLGTAGYLSPEQARGEKATPASDRYALAVVAFELLTGARPFESESPTAEATAHVQAEVPAVSPQLDPVLQRALAKDPEHRFPTAAAFVAALRSALGDGTATTRVLPVGRRSPWPLIAAIVVAALLAGAGPGSGPRPRRGRLDRASHDRAADDGSATSASRAASTTTAAPTTAASSASAPTAAASASSTTAAGSKRHRPDRSGNATARAGQLRGRGPARGSGASIAQRERPALRGICGVRPRSRSGRAWPVRRGATAPGSLRAASGTPQGDRSRTKGVQAPLGQRGRSSFCVRWPACASSSPVRPVSSAPTSSTTGSNGTRTTRSSRSTS